MDKSRPVNYTSAEFQAFFKRNRGKIILTVVLFILVIILISESTFIVGEAEQSVVTRFGVIKRIIINSHNDFHDRYTDLLQDEISFDEDVKIVVGSGLQFKVPFIDKVETYSSRLYTYISDAEIVKHLREKAVLHPDLCPMVHRGSRAVLPEARQYDPGGEPTG